MSLETTVLVNEILNKENKIIVVFQDVFAKLYKNSEKLINTELIRFLYGVKFYVCILFFVFTIIPEFMFIDLG